MSLETPQLPFFRIPQIAYFSIMKTATVKEIKEELLVLPEKEMLELCLRLVKFKKENKELLTYLLFEAGDETAFVNSVKEEIDSQFQQLNTKNFFLAKKTIRKVVRTATKFIRYSGSKQTEIELLIHVCKIIRASDLNIRKSPALANLYAAQLKKINAALATMHEDLQYDYEREIKALSL
jgi:hypothetical protein